MRDMIAAGATPLQKRTKKNLKAEFGMGKVERRSGSWLKTTGLRPMEVGGLRSEAHISSKLKLKEFQAIKD